ncbi:MAG: hypothetical protein AAF633_09415 [Chloroflexota bacterium]
MNLMLGFMISAFILGTIFSKWSRWFHQLILLGIAVVMAIGYLFFNQV